MEGGGDKKWNEPADLRFQTTQGGVRHEVSPLIPDRSFQGGQLGIFLIAEDLFIRCSVSGGCTFLVKRQRFFGRSLCRFIILVQSYSQENRQPQAHHRKKDPEYGADATKSIHIPSLSPPFRSSYPPNLR
jgi:hypothetical protein